MVFGAPSVIRLLIPISKIGRGFSDYAVLWFLMPTLGTVFLISFVVCEWYMQDQVMIPLRLFRNQAVAALAQCFLMGIVFEGVFVYLPLYFQLVLDKAVIESATLILRFVISQSIASVASGQYIAPIER